MSIPAAPCTSGSMTTAATSSPCSASRRSMSPASPGAAFSVSKSSGRKIAWNSSMPPTDTAPSVSPW